MESKILILPLRQTAAVSLTNEISKLIDQEYHQSSTAFTEQLKTIDELRQQVCVNSPDTQSVVKLKKYYAYLTILEKKFQSGIEFIWTNCLTNSDSFTQKSFRFERISILYQLAAIFSRLAIGDVELKTSGVYSQYAAGCLEEISKDLELSGEFNSRYDININSIRSLYYLILAQSQEIFWLKALNDSLRNTVLIRLSTQVSKFYEMSFEYAQMGDYFNNDWHTYLKAKAIHFEAATLFRYSQHALQKGKYGEEISYLRQAQLLLAQQPQTCLKSDILRNSREMRETIHKRLSIAERENELVHLQRVPQFDEFKKIPGAQLANAVLPRELTVDYIQETNDLTIFESLVPLSVIETGEKIKHAIFEILNFKIMDPNIGLQQDIESFIKNSQIQSQLDSIVVPQRLPESVTIYRQKILDQGYIAQIVNKMNEINGLKVQCRSRLDQIWAKIKEDFQDDESLTSFYGVDKWQLKGLIDDPEGNRLIENFKTFEEYINQAEQGDMVVVNQINDLNPYLEIYKTQDSLESYIPESQLETLNPRLVECVSRLKFIINKLNDLRIKCISQLDEVNNKMEQVSASLINQIIKEYRSNNRVQSDAIVENYVKGFDDEIVKVEVFKATEETIKIEFNSSTQSFLDAKKSIRISNEREQALEVLNSTYQGYFEILGNLNQGLEFYHNLKARIEVEEGVLLEFLIKRKDIKNQLQKVR